MTEPPPPRSRLALTLLLWATSLAFIAILSPFLSPILWGLIVALMFAPVFRLVLPRFGHHRTAAAMTTVVIAVVLVVLPFTLLVLALASEVGVLYARLQSGEWNPDAQLHRLFNALPEGVRSILDRLGLGSFYKAKLRVTAALTAGLQAMAAGAIDIGQDMFRWVVNLFIALYLSFFFIRDGNRLLALLRDALPLALAHKQALASTFATVLRATVKGSLVVAGVQGALGGVAFALLGLTTPLLWAVLMGVLALVPVVGSALVWLPVALYLLATGEVASGIALIAYGVLVIGLIDNLLRPFLVGQDTRMPDYLVMISTLGGLAILGVDGLVLGPAIAAMFIAVWKIDIANRRAEAHEEPAPHD